MLRVKNRSLLPQGLGRGARIAHKTGDIGFLLGDSGIVYMPNGKRYLISVLVGSRVYDDYDAMYYIRDVSKIVYSYMNNVSNNSRLAKVKDDAFQGRELVFSRPDVKQNLPLLRLNNGSRRP